MEVNLGFRGHWDFGDGTTSALQNPTHIYPSIGQYSVTLTVTDGLNQIATDDTLVYIDVPNVPPEIPTIDGPTTGKPAESYEFFFSASDQNDDKVLYYIDWGDNTTSGWIGPFGSGVTISKNHTWSTKGSYQIKVKAKDWHGAESIWSGPLRILHHHSRADDRTKRRVWHHGDNFEHRGCSCDECLLEHFVRWDVCFSLI